MKITSFFKPDAFFVLDNQQFDSKKQVIELIAEKLAAQNYVTNKEKTILAFEKREQEFSTGIGNHLAIPHIREDFVKENLITFLKVKDVDWGSLDGKQTKYVFAISLKKEGAQNLHVDILQQLSSFFLDEKFIQQLAQVNNFNDLILLLEKFENETQKVASISTEKVQKYKIVAVTACPTGIAILF